MLDMDHRLTRMEDKLLIITEGMSRNTAILEVNTELLDDHIKRTDLLEEQVRSMAVEARVVRWLAAGSAIVAVALQLYTLYKG
jgi:hypothetical protein